MQVERLAGIEGWGLVYKGSVGFSSGCEITQRVQLGLTKDFVTGYSVVVGRIVGLTGCEDGAPHI